MLCPDFAIYCLRAEEGHEEVPIESKK
jgi:hypothetical protein